MEGEAIHVDVSIDKMQFIPISYTPLEISLYLPEEIRFTSYPPAYIRSLIDTAFLRSVCTHDGNCSECYLRSVCAYVKFLRPQANENYLIKAGSEIPPAYTIIANWKRRRYPPDSVLTFRLNFFGNISDFLPYLVAGLRNLEKIGFPSIGVQFRLLSLYSTTKIVYERKEDKIHKPIRIIVNPDSIPKANCATLQFLSPVFLKNRASQHTTPTFDDLLKSIMRRYSWILKFHQKIYWHPDHTFFEKKDSVLSSFTDYEWHIFKKNKKGKENPMVLQGFTGSLHVCGLQPYHLFLINVGQHIQVGGKTSFGFGHYSVSYWNEKDESYEPK